MERNNGEEEGGREQQNISDMTQPNLTESNPKFANTKHVLEDINGDILQCEDDKKLSIKATKFIKTFRFEAMNQQIVFPTVKF
jgi:hypothetical protein